VDLHIGTRLDIICFTDYFDAMGKMIQTLEVDSVILEFGDKRVLQDVYLKCETNKITGLLGLNGAGKSCLMNIIYGKLKPLNGMVRINKQA